MTVGLRKLIDGASLSYLKHQIGSGNPVPTKNALQDLCGLYRRGYRIHPAELYGVQTSIIGLCDRQPDSKVQRWALNSLAQIGDADSLKPIMRALEDHANDPEIVTAGVAALYKLSPATAEANLRRHDFSGQMVTLAALQHVRPDQIRLAGLPVDVQKADPETIKAALLVVGLDRAPPNMFDPSYSNAEIVKVVSRHVDPMVSQYSVWAITENSGLTIADLGIELSDVVSQSDNVRGWVYRLIAMDQAHCLKHLDFVGQASADAKAEARLGLAHGMRDTFFEQLVPVVLDWFTRELNGEVRQGILDHIITHAGKSPDYREYAEDAYKRAGAADRERMRGTASKTVMYGVFKQIDIQLDGGLFVTNINLNNNQIGSLGAIGGAGSITNSGDIIFQPKVTELLKGQLAQAGILIDTMPLPETEKLELASAITDAQANPTNGTVGRVISGLSKAAGLVTAVVGAEESLKQIIDGLGKLTGHN